MTLNYTPDPVKPLDSLGQELFQGDWVYIATYSREMDASKGRLVVGMIDTAPNYHVGYWDSSSQLWVARVRVLGSKSSWVIRHKPARNLVKVAKQC